MDPCTLDASTLFFGTPMVQDNGQKIIPMSTVEGQFNWNTRLNLQFGSGVNAMLTSDWGIATPIKGADPTRRNLELNLSPDMITALKKFDEDIAKLATKNTQEWFKKATLDKQYMPLVKKNEKKGHDVVRLKVAVGKGKGDTEIRVVDGNVTRVRPFTDLERVPNCQMMVVVSTPGIWANATQFGVSFTARGIIAKVSPRQSGLSIFSGMDGFVDAPGDDPSMGPEKSDDVVMADDC